MSRSLGTYGVGATGTEAEIEPRRLELSLNPEDGSLMTAPLLNVVLAATDNLHNDIYNMAHGEIEVTSAQPAGGNDEDEDEGNNNAGGEGGTAAQPATGEAVRKEKMSNLSFAQRRHELAWRLASHGKTITHVAALTAAAATTNSANATQVSTRALQHARTAWVQADEAQDALYFFHAQLFPARAAPHDVYGALDTLLAGSWPDLPQDLKLTVDRYETSQEKAWTTREVADRWNMAVRDKLLRGEMGWMRKTSDRLHSAWAKERHTGQPGPPQTQQSPRTKHATRIPLEHKVPWKISLRGGIVRLTHGRPKITVTGASAVATDHTPNHDSTVDNNNTSDKNDAVDTKTTYPIEAVLTVLSTSQPAQWTLVNIEVHAQAKTGQSNHQLDTTNRQRFDLHRLCALAMSKEEARAKLAREEHEKKQAKEEDGAVKSAATSSTGEGRGAAAKDDAALVARPLHAMFQVAHVFSLSWQLEILSAQAQSLRKGIWGTSSSSIVVTPVQFFENRSNILGIVSISFWSVDDRYGPPSMGDLHDLLEESEEHSGDDDEYPYASSGDSVSTVSRSITNPSVTNQLTLSVRAEQNVGIRVALSGAESIMELATSTTTGPRGSGGEKGNVVPGDDQHKPQQQSPQNAHIRSTIRELLIATSNPFSLSASEALMAATRLCAERKCYAMVHVLPSVLPSWISLSVERGSIAVAARIGYSSGSQKAAEHGTSEGTIPSNSSRGRDPVVLFRLTCDARIGTFASTFARSTDLLQRLACNDPRAASDMTSLRIAQYASNRRRARSSGAVALASGRAVRDAFEGLYRSMNVLGQRTGVGGAWKDNDDMSSSLRARAIQMACKDVKVSMVTCCGIAAIYGLSAVALSVATGVTPLPDMAGGAISAKEAGGVTLVPAPPLTILVDQNLVENTSRRADGERIKETHTEQEFFGVCCSVSDEKGLTLHGTTLGVRLDTPIAVPNRTSCTLTPLVANGSASTGAPVLITADEEPATKRMKTNDGDRVDGGAVVASTGGIVRDLMVEVEHFASILSDTLEL